MRKVISFLAILACGLAPAYASAQDAPPRPLDVVAVNVTARTQDRGPAAVPGDVIEVRLIFTNLTEGEVRNVVFDNPVPVPLTYVGESAGADARSVRVDLSIDGGETYSERPMIAIIDSGRELRVPAPPEQVTHIRWTLIGGVAPGAQVTAMFRARAPTPEASAPNP